MIKKTVILLMGSDSGKVIAANVIKNPQYVPPTLVKMTEPIYYDFKLNGQPDQSLRIMDEISFTEKGNKTPEEIYQIICADINIVDMVFVCIDLGQSKLTDDDNDRNLEMYIMLLVKNRPKVKLLFIRPDSLELEMRPRLVAELNKCQVLRNANVELDMSDVIFLDTPGTYNRFQNNFHHDRYHERITDYRNKSCNVLNRIQTIKTYPTTDMFDGDINTVDCDDDNNTVGKFFDNDPFCPANKSNKHNIRDKFGRKKMHCNRYDNYYKHHNMMKYYDNISRTKLIDIICQF